MGILDFFIGIQEPVEGTYRITKATRIIQNSTVGPCDMVGELTSSGRAPRVLEHYSALTPREKWPIVGDTLPVVFDKTNSEFMRITWKQVPARPATA